MYNSSDEPLNDEEIQISMNSETIENFEEQYENFYEQNFDFSRNISTENSESNKDRKPTNNQTVQNGKENKEISHIIPPDSTQSKSTFHSTEKSVKKFNYPYRPKFTTKIIKYSLGKKECKFQLIKVTKKRRSRKTRCDNLRNECKTIIVKISIQKINNKLNENEFKSLLKGIFPKKLLVLKKNKNDNTKRYNKELLKKTLGTILSQKISSRYSQYQENHNEILIEKLKTLNSNNKDVVKIKNFLNMTLEDFILFLGADEKSKENKINIIFSAKEFYRMLDECLKRNIKKKRLLYITIKSFISDIKNMRNKKKKK